MEFGSYVRERREALRQQVGDGRVLVGLFGELKAKKRVPFWLAALRDAGLRDRVALLVVGRADYCGVNKKGMFTVMNYILPTQQHLSMHCSANVGKSGDGAILFGLWLFANRTGRD